MVKSFRIPTRAITGSDLHLLQFGNAHPDKRDSVTAGNFRNPLSVRLDDAYAGEEVEVSQYDNLGALIVASVTTLTTVGPHIIIPQGANPRYVQFNHTAGTGKLVIINAETQGNAEIGDLPITYNFVSGPNPDQAHASIATTVTASTLATLGYTLDDDTDYLVVQAIGGNVRMSLNGTDPTTSLGIRIADGSLVQLSRTEALVAEFITESSAPKLEIAGYRL